MTYRIVHELEKVLLEVIFGGCPELGVLHYVGRHPRRLFELQDFVDLSEAQTKGEVQL